MKKGFFLGVAATLLVGFALVGVAAVFGGVLSRASPGSADALAGSEDRYAYPAAAPAMEAAPAPEPLMEESKMGKKDAPARKKAMLGKVLGDSQGFGGLGLSGTGEGGGGLGSAIGLGGIGTKGRGGNFQPAPKDEAKEEADGESSGAAGAATRAWFPETFLFEPLILTDAQGRANVPVKVPDRLTSWRVLALAHSREGGQAGSVASFLGTLPTYVDPVVPAFLVAGDEVRLPIQVVNTTETGVKSKLSLSAINASLSTAGGAVDVPAGGNTVQFVTLKTTRPGEVGLKATLGDTDSIERVIQVKPAGRLVSVSKGGTLAAPRQLTLEGPADPLPDSEQVRLQVFPGALALLRGELSASPGRGGVAEDGYTLLLAGKAASLLGALGAEPDLDVLRDLSVLAGQRVIRHARTADVAKASLLAEAALAHPENPVLARLGERLAQTVADKQRPDGTCEGGNGWTLQRLLVTTSACVAAARAAKSTDRQKQRAIAVTLRAQGAFERNLGRLDDAYTAAAILASGAVDGTSLVAPLEEKVLAAIKEGENGAKFLQAESGVVRADGTPAPTAEATALAALALAKNPKHAALAADLGTWLLGNYSQSWGWGDGATNLWALRAVLELFKAPVPANVKITLARDGKEVSSGSFSAKQMFDVLSLQADAPGSAGAHQWSVSAEPPVPGLGFALALQAHVPWKDEPGGGLELFTTLPEKLQVGLPAPVTLTASAPAGEPIALRFSLPAGVQADSPSLEALVAAGTVTRYETEDGAIILHLPAMNAGASFTGSLKVVPTLAGTLHAAASTLTPENRPQLSRPFKPAVWSVK